MNYKAIQVQTKRFWHGRGGYLSPERDFFFHVDVTANQFLTFLWATLQPHSFKSPYLLHQLFSLS